MRNLHFTTGLLGAALLLFTGCPKKQDMEQLTAKAWLLETLNGEPAGLGMNKQPRYFLLREGNRINGFGGCNNFMGSYELDGDQIKVGNLAGTLMACPPGFSDRPFHQALQEAEQVALKDGKLLLKKGKDVLATFRPTEPHLIGSTELKNTRWVLRMVNNHTFQLPEGARELFIQFPLGDEPKVRGFSGCNNFMGTYEMDGAQLRFGPLAGTKMACREPLGELEEEVLKALEEVDKYQILGERLILKNGDRSVASFEAVYL